MNYYTVEYWYVIENKGLSGSLSVPSTSLTGAFQNAIKQIEKKGIPREALTRMNITETQS